MKILVATIFAAFLAQTVHASMVETGSASIGQSITASSITVSSSGASVFSITAGSGVHVQAGRIQLDSGSMIAWPDGTTSTTTLSNSIPAFPVPNSGSQRITADNTFLNVQFSTTVPGSTVTLTMNGTHALATFSCTITNGTCTYGGLGLLVNGNYVDGESGTTYSPLNSTGVDDVPIGLSYLTQNTYNGSTSFSLIVEFTGGASCSIELNQGALDVCQFAVTEH